MKQSVLVLGNSDSGLYDFRKEVLMALMQEGYELPMCRCRIPGIWKKSKNWAVFVMRR